jgi:hypothetical protein
MADTATIQPEFKTLDELYPFSKPEGIIGYANKRGLIIHPEILDEIDTFIYRMKVMERFRSTDLFVYLCELYGNASNSPMRYIGQGVIENTLEKVYPTYMDADRHVYIDYEYDRDDWSAWYWRVNKLLF